jgi:uncharacterized membrane protein YqhA
MTFSKRAWIIFAVVIALIALWVLFITPSGAEVADQVGRITKNLISFGWMKC